MYEFLESLLSETAPSHYNLEGKLLVQHWFCGY